MREFPEIIDVKTSVLGIKRCYNSNKANVKGGGDKSKRRAMPCHGLQLTGNHTLKDIDGAYAVGVRAAGYQASTELRGLAEITAIRSIYVERVRRLTGR